MKKDNLQTRMNDATHPAAQFSRGLNISGWSDWVWDSCIMTKDNLQTRMNYQNSYYGSVGVAMIELELIDLMTENLGFDGMIYARELLDEKIPLWK